MGLHGIEVSSELVKVKTKLPTVNFESWTVTFKARDSAGKVVTRLTKLILTADIQI